MFRKYNIVILFRGIIFQEVWIDPHYEMKHTNSINDDLILNLLHFVHQNTLLPLGPSETFEYYEQDIEFHGRYYRLILVIPPDKSYIGVRNAYRRAP
jgi:hypothetical protein